MGTDIHGFAQRFMWKTDSGTEYWDAFSPVPDERCYSLFAALANVRNEDSLNCISRPRGLPKYVAANGDIGEHSFTYLSPSEILAWDGWEQSIGYDDEPVFVLHELRAVKIFLAWCKYLNEYSSLDRVTIILGFDC